MSTQLQTDTELNSHTAGKFVAAASTGGRSGVGWLQNTGPIPEVPTLLTGFV